MLSLWITYKSVLLAGLYLTLKLNLISIIIGLPLGIFLFSGRTSGRKVISIVSIMMIEALKGVPALVLMFWLYIALPLLLNIRLSAETSAITALALNYSANAAELFRSAWATANYELGADLQLMGIPSDSSILFFKAPFLLVNTIPGLIAQTANTIKLSAVAAFIGVPEVFHATQSVIQDTYRPVELYSFLALFYVLIISAISIIDNEISRYLGVRK